MEVASGGTLFLDEIGNLSLPMQAKLLTAIEKKADSPSGCYPFRADRCPADLCHEYGYPSMVQEGTFRQDLLYRINTIELHIPPLRKRGK